MSKPRLVLEKQSEPKSRKLITIDSSLHEQLLDVKHETGLSLTVIVDKFIAYGIANVEIEDPDTQEV